MVIVMMLQAIKPARQKRKNMNKNLKNEIRRVVNAVGIPAETGHYGNEISFFVSMNQMTAAHDASYAAQESRINAIERATWQDEQGEI